MVGIFPADVLHITKNRIFFFIKAISVHVDPFFFSFMFRWVVFMLVTPKTLGWKLVSKGTHSLRSAMSFTIRRYIYSWSFTPDFPSYGECLFVHEVCWLGALNTPRDIVKQAFPGAP